MLGTFLTIDSTIFTEILSASLKFLVIDREHSSFSLERSRDLINAINSNCYAFIRVSSCNQFEIQKTLELNPDGIFIPQINGLDMARQAVSFSKYPPIGVRGLSPYTKPLNYSPDGLKEKLNNINSKLKISLLIEGKSGVESISDIVTELGEHIYCIYFGLYDFSASLQVEPSWLNSDVIHAAEKIISICKRKGIIVGSIARTNEEISLLRNYGFDLVVYQNDVAIVSDGLSRIMLD